MYSSKKELQCQYHVHLGRKRVVKLYFFCFNEYKRKYRCFVAEQFTKENRKEEVAEEQEESAT